MFYGSWSFLVGVAKQAESAASSRARGLTSGSWPEPGVLECPLQFTTVYETAFIL